MRDHRLGVGDVGEMSSRARKHGKPTNGDDRRIFSRQLEPRVVVGRTGDEHDATDEPSRHGIGGGDGARRELRARGVHVAGSSGYDGLRVDELGVGDVGEVPGWAWGGRD